MGKREEAARAVCKLAKRDPDMVISGKPLWMLHLKTVDAVIACIREPDEKMITAGYGSFDSTGPKVIWQAMIDAIGD